MGKIEVRKTIVDSVYMIGNSAIPLLLFELIYKLMMFLIFRPMINIIVGIFLKIGGYSILMNTDIKAFFTSIVGLAMTLLLMLISIILVFYEFTTILLILEKARNKDKIDLLDMTGTALSKVQNALKENHLGLALYILILIPILNIGIQSSLLPSLSIPNFITGEIYKYPGGRILVAGVFLGLIYLFAKLFIVLPLMVFSNKTFGQAYEKSYRTIKGSGFKISISVLILLVGWISIAYIPSLVFRDVSGFVLKAIRTLLDMSMMVFTLLISPLILSVSLSVYCQYVEKGLLVRSETETSINLGFWAKRFRGFLNYVFLLMERILVKAQNHPKVVVVSIVIGILGMGIVDFKGAEPFLEEPIVIGHRGSTLGVENTLEAILGAAALGAEYAEIDVLLSKDGVPMVVHDNNLKRLSGKSKSISKLLAEDIEKIEIREGSSKGKIMSLEKMARKLDGRIDLMVELKTHGRETKSVVEESVKALERAKMIDKTIFQTSENKIIDEFKKKYPELTIGYIVIGQIGQISYKKTSNMDVDFFSYEESLVDKRLIRSIHRAGRPVFVWTVNDDYKAEILYGLGIDGIITDYPNRITRVRDKFLN